MLGDLLQRKPYNAVTDFVDAPVARGLAEKTAFIDAKRSLSYGELQKRTCRFATALADLGLKPEERLALLLYDTIDFPVAFWGALRAGIVALPLNTLLTAEQYAYILADSRTSAIVVAAPLAKTLIPILDRLPRLRTIILVEGDANSAPLFLRARFAILRISSAAEQPKYLPHRHCRTKSRSGCTPPVRPANQRRQAHPHDADGRCAPDGQRVIGIREDESCFSAAKLFFSYGIGNAMAFPMSVGATTVLLPNGRPRKRCSRCCAGTSRPYSSAYPRSIAMLLAHKDMCRGAGSDRLRLVHFRRRSAAGARLASAGAPPASMSLTASARPRCFKLSSAISPATSASASTGKPVPGYELQDRR